MVKLDLCTIIAAPIERCFDLARSIELHLLGTERTGEEAIGGVTTGLIGPGQYVRWRARHLGIKQILASRITAYHRPTYFQDTMIEGAFRFMQHDHFFTEIAPNVTEMKDHFVFEAPLSVLGIAAEVLLLRRYMTRFLLRRNEILKQVAESSRWVGFVHPVNQSC
jgi:ligand-binding SRPBCC domain-containing protein